MANHMKKWSNRGGCIGFCFFLILAISCSPTIDDTNSIAYTDDMNPYLGQWTMTYFTNGKVVDTINVTRVGERLQLSYNDDIVLPKFRKSQLEFRIDSDPRKYFEGKIMGSRLWGTMKYEKGEYALQRLQWEGQRIED